MAFTNRNKYIGFLPVNRGKDASEGRNTGVIAIGEPKQYGGATMA
jgi:hypothetical protein